MDALCVLVLVVLASGTLGHDCTRNCDPETGLRKETLYSDDHSYKDYSQCADPDVCDNSTPGTGHTLFTDLTEDLIAVERCYSFCYSNVTGLREGNATLFADDLYASPACSVEWKEVHVCFSSCLFALKWEAVFDDPDDTVSKLVLDPNTTCSDFCHIHGGVYTRAFPNSPINSSCMQEEICPKYCQLVETSFPPQSSGDALTYSGELELTLDYTSNVTLRKDGVLEFRIDYYPPPSHLNSTIPAGVAYGLIWRVTYSEDKQTVNRYIPQHLPFLLSPDKVGRLYRIGSNMLAIKDLQCKQQVTLSYALVNARGISEFSKMQPQCFYGSWFPIPPSNITIKLGFDYPSGELRLEIISHDLSPDQEYVEGYRVQIVSPPSTESCNEMLGYSYTIQNDIAFDSKDNLTLIVRGTKEVQTFFPSLVADVKSCHYLIGVYALPQRHKSATNESVFPATNWKGVDITLPDYAKIQGKSTREAFPDPITGLYDVSYTYNVTSHWTSLAVIQSVFGQLTKSRKDELTIPNNNQFTLVLNVTPSQTVYHFQFHGIPPTGELEDYSFERMYTARYNEVTLDHFDKESFNLTACSPSKVRNLSGSVEFDKSKGTIMASLSWIGPERPCGKVHMYKIVLSSPKTIQDKINEIKLNVKNNASAENMTLLVRTDIVAHVRDDDVFNFSVHAVSEWGAEGAVAIYQAMPNDHAVVHDLLPYQIGIIAAVGSLLVVCLVMVIVIGCFFQCRKKAVVRKSSLWEIELSRAILRSASTEDDWEVDPDHIFVKEKLGEGSFGEVYRGQLTSDVKCLRAKKHVEDMCFVSKKEERSCSVAIKLLKSNAPGETLQNFLNEINMMKKVACGDNPYVVKMVGCVSAQKPYALVLEYVPYGSVLDYLRENRKLAHKRIKLKEVMQLTMGSVGDTETDGGPRDSQLELGRASPYLEPVQHTVNQPRSSNLLSPGIPHEYLEPLPSPTPVVPPANHQESGSTPMQNSTEPASPVCSTALNPLYSNPELHELYVELGELEPINLMAFSYQIASGMEYLASMGIVHRDLACRNVLIDRNKNLKISDFGLSRETDLYVCSTQGRLPLRWMSPEAITERLFTEHSDVWAYGITIWEICTLGGYPYATLPNKDVLPSLLQGQRLKKPYNCSEEIYQIMLDCWHMESDERPSFKQLKALLDSLLAKHQPDAYINFSDIDVDKLLNYNQGFYIDESEGSNNDAMFRYHLQTKVQDGSIATVTLATMATATTAPQTLAGAAQDTSDCAVASTLAQSCHDVGTFKPAVAVLPDRSSTSTIRDDSDDEETKV